MGHFMVSLTPCSKDRQRHLPSEKIQAQRQQEPTRFFCLQIAVPSRNTSVVPRATAVPGNVLEMQILRLYLL